MKIFLVRISFLMLVFFGLNSCTDENGKEIVLNETELKDSIKIPTLHKIIEKTLKKQLTEITPLPFTYSSVSQNISLPLPTIDSIIYLPLNTGFDYNFTQRVALNHLKTFSNELPSIKGIEVYYSEFNCDNHQDSALRDVCDNFAGLNVGFLIFFNTSSSTAQIVNINNSYFIDSGVDMSFEVDTNYQIYVSETGMTDGDIAPDGTLEADIYDISKHHIELDTDGFLVVKQLE